jgi:hypothetical protein
MLQLRTNATVRIDCGFRELDTHSNQDGILRLQDGSTLWLQNCYLNVFKDTEHAFYGGPWPSSFPNSNQNFFPGSADSVVRMENCTIRWWNEV